MNQPFNPMQPYPMVQPGQPVQPVQPYAQPYPGVQPGQPGQAYAQPYPAPPYQPAFHQGPYPYPAGTYPLDIVSPNTNPMPWAGPYHDPSAMGTDDDDNILTRKYGGVPVWGWAVGAAALGGAGLFVYHKYLKPKSGEPAPASSDSDEDLKQNRTSDEWSPSRSGFGDKIDGFLKEQKLRGVKVYIDADEAAKVIKTPSPLITLRVPHGTSLHTNQMFVTMCDSEGLKPIETADGVVGLYPNKGKKAKAWEQYIDDLRDEGQQT